MTGPLPVVASAWLRPRLGTTWRTGHVLGVTPRAAYVSVDPCPSSVDGPSTPRGVLAIETAEAVGLPNGLEVADPDVLAPMAPGQPVTLAAGRVTAGDWSLAVRRWRRTRPVPGPAVPAVVRDRLGSLGVTGARPLPAGWPDPDPRLVAGAAGLADVVTGGGGPGGVDRQLARLLGYGPGSTPAGDDVVAAVVATATVLAGRWGVPTPGLALLGDRATALAPDRTTALSATLLTCARDGAMARPAAAALDALTGAPDDGVERVAAALDDLARVGHSSGRDLALGLLAVMGVLAVVAPSRAEGDDDGHHLLPSTTHDRSS